MKRFETAPISSKHPRLRDRECAIMHLCHQRGFEIDIMFVKVLKGNAAAVDTLQLNLSDRDAVVDAAFSFLAEQRKCPVIVAGDLGVGLSTVHQYIRSNDLQNTVQTHCIPKQSFHTFFCSPRSAFRCTTINTDNPRMLAYQFEVKGGDPHPTTKVKHEKSLLN